MIYSPTISIHVEGVIMYLMTPDFSHKSESGYFQNERNVRLRL